MPSHIVIVSPSSGGAEKRFFDVYTSMRRRGDDVRLVGPQSLVDQLRADHPDRADVLDGLVAVPMQGPWRRITFVRAFRRLLSGWPRGEHYHYPLNCLWPLHLGRGDRVTMSVADCTSVPGPLAGKRTSLWAWVSFFFAQRIDVLSPAVHAAMRGYSTARKMSLTPGGTFIVPSPAAAVAREPSVVFLGRLVAGKGLDDLLDALPAAWGALRERAPAGTTFRIAGYGPLQEHVEARVKAIADAGVPIVFDGYAVSHQLLARARVLLSVQETTNYPSRVVAEALMAGCAVVVRDTGDSRAFGDDLPGLVYCAGNLDPGELANRLASLLGGAAARPSFHDEIAGAARHRFHSATYIDYFGAVFGTP